MNMCDAGSWGFPELETDRCILKLMTANDAPALFAIYSDDDVTRYMDIASLSKVEEAAEMIEFDNGRAERLQGCRYGIFDKVTGQLMGTCGFNTWDRHHTRKAEIGYDLAKQHWGKGVTREALTALLTLGFTEMNVNRVEALVLPGATQSMSVLRKLGFTQEGLLRQYGHWLGQFWDEYMYSLLRDDWMK